MDWDKCWHFTWLTIIVWNDSKFVLCVKGQCVSFFNGEQRPQTNKSSTCPKHFKCASGDWSNPHSCHFWSRWVESTLSLNNFCGGPQDIVTHFAFSWEVFESEVQALMTPKIMQQLWLHEPFSHSWRPSLCLQNPVLQQATINCDLVHSFRFCPAFSTSFFLGIYWDEFCFLCEDRQSRVRRSLWPPQTPNSTCPACGGAHMPKGQRHSTFGLEGSKSLTSFGRHRQK